MLPLFVVYSKDKDIYIDFSLLKVKDLCHDVTRHQNSE